MTKISLDTSKSDLRKITKWIFENKIDKLRLRDICKNNRKPLSTENRKPEIKKLEILVDEDIALYYFSYLIHKKMAAIALDSSGVEYVCFNYVGKEKEWKKMSEVNFFGVYFKNPIKSAWSIVCVLIFWSLSVIAARFLGDIISPR